ncbi:tetratricopeptide repeat protein [Hwanghaeella sp.]|uniref:tetratricopeptide repeat protein n=1 Tax=Hwanghaeella sp. TaxID=2605943 RepID=UPI003CCB858F
MNGLFPYRALRPNDTGRTRFSRTVLLSGVFAAVLLAAAPASRAQETIGTRAGVHPDFGRIVFDWPRQVGFETALEGGDLVIRFDSPLQTDFGPVLTNLGDYIQGAAIEQGGRTVRLTLARPVTINGFRSGTAVAIDMRPAAEAAGGSEAANAPDLSVRVGQHPTYTRIVFDWPETTEYAVASENDSITVRFQRPARIDTTALANRLPQGFGRPRSGTRGGETVFILPMPQGTTVRDLVAGTKVVIDLTAGDGPLPTDVAQPNDLLPGSATAETPPATQAAETATEQAAAQPNAAQPTADDAAPTEPAVVADEPPAEQVAAAEAPAAAEVAAAEQQTESAAGPTPGPSTEETAEAPAGPVNLVPPTDQAEAAAEEEARKILEAEDARAAQEAAEEAAAAQALAAAEAEQQAPAPETSEPELQTRVRTPAPEQQGPVTAEQLATQQALQDGTIQFLRDGSGRQVTPEGPAPVSFSFDWPDEVGAAVYRRGENIWVVFDRHAQLDLIPLREQGAPILDRVEQLPISGATVLRMRAADPGITPVVKLEGFTWVVDFRLQPFPPRVQAEIRAEADPDIGPKLLFPTANPGNLVTIPDPDVGDTLLVATYRDPGVGIAGTRSYPEFRVLSSAQGVVVEPHGDDVLFERSFDGFTVSGTEGLHISAVSPEAPVSTAQSFSARRLFNFEEWVRGGPGDFLAGEYALLASITEVPEDKRNDARLDLVRFYAARDRGAEATGVLDVVESEAESYFKKADARALRGVVRTLNNDLEEARTDLSDPRLDGFAEAALWRGAVLAKLGDWKQAADHFKVADSILRDYPYPLKAKLGLLRVETALSTRDLRAASSWLDELDVAVDELTRGQYAELRFHQGRVAHASDDLDLAKDFWSELIDGNDLKYAARAEYLMINVERRQGDITDDEVIDRLERLRFKWRGDGFEFNVLRRLGQVYVDKGDYFNGLSTWRLAVTYFAEDPAAKELAQDMTDLFRRLYIDGEADKMPPLRALALYDEFRELTPSGRDGDLLIELLANRLVDVDLLERAANLLQQQVEFRLQGEERARVGAKLAFIKILDNDPLGAVEALNKTEFPQITRELEDDRRRLQAKANYELDRDNEAIKLLAGDTSIEADILRQDIYRKAENWTEAAKVLQRLSGDPPEEGEEIPEPSARHVVNWAVALKLDKDEAGLAQIRELYGPAMNISPFRDVFNYIVAPNDQGGASLQASLQQLAGGDGFNAFMENYRDRLLTPSLNSEERAPVTSGQNNLNPA